MREFYVYLHCRQDSSPFYVGKGCGQRAYKFHKNRNKHYKNIVAKVGVNNVKVYVIPCQSEQAAFAEEVRLILILKAAGYDLANKTNGGEGASGFTHSDSVRLKISITHKGKKFSDEHKLKISTSLKGRKRPPFSDEWREKLTAKLRSHTITPEIRAKLSASSKGNKNALGLKRGPMPQGQRAKVSASKKGNSPAWNKGLPSTLRGRKLSEETKNNMRMAQQRRRLAE